MKKAYYFSHDQNARNDPKVLIMRVDYGEKGYGRYWMIVETLAEATEYKLKLNETNIKGMALSLNIPYKSLIKFINDCINKYHLFVKDKSGEYFYSETLVKRLSLRDNITQRLKDAGIKGAKKRWGKSKHPIKVATDPIKEKKLYSDNVYLTDEELEKLQSEYGKEIVEDYIEKLNRYIVEYILSGQRKPYQSHYLTIRAWIRKSKREKLLESGSFNEGGVYAEKNAFVDLRKLEKGKK